MPDDHKHRKISERLGSAKRFNELGVQELRDALSLADDERTREACEKIFHALVEAATARVQKYGLDPPIDHTEVLAGLRATGEMQLVKAYEDALTDLHMLAYYRGWLNKEKISTTVAQTQKAIDQIDRYLRRT